jgi:hypothetical protein
VCYEQWGAHQSKEWAEFGSALGKMGEKGP